MVDDTATLCESDGAVDLGGAGRDTLVVEAGSTFDEGWPGELGIKVFRRPGSSSPVRGSTASASRARRDVGHATESEVVHDRRPKREAGSDRRVRPDDRAIESSDREGPRVMPGRMARMHEKVLFGLRRDPRGPSEDDLRRGAP